VRGEFSGDIRSGMLALGALLMIPESRSDPTYEQTAARC